MANVAKTIEIIFAGTDNMSGTIKNIGSSLETFGTDLQDIGAPFADATEKVLLFEAALIALSIGGLTLAVVKSGEFATGMNEINTLLDVSGDTFEDYSSDIIEYSKNSTASMDDLQLALYNLISLGGDYATSLESLAVIEKLSVATKTDMVSTTETLIGTMNAYGAGIDEASDYSDTFFTIIQDGKTTLPELSTSIAQVTGIAATAGISFETLGATIAAMTATGAPTSQAITSIKAAIQALIAPTEATSLAAKALGIELGQSAVESQGFEVVLKQIYDAASGDIEIMKTMIPSIEGLSAASILGADSAGVLAKALVDMGNNTGATEKAFEKMKDNLNLTWQTMTNNFDAIFIKMGLSLGDGASDLIKGFTDLFGAIGQGFDEGEFDSISEFINKFIIEITDAVSDVATNIPDALGKVDFNDLIQSFEDVITQIKNMFDDFDIDLTTVEGLTKAIQLVVDSIGSLQSVTSGIMSAFIPLLAAGKATIDMLNDMDEETKKLVGQILGLGAQLTIVGSILGIGGVLVGGIGSLMSALGGLGVLFVSGGALATGLTGLIVLLGPIGVLGATLALAEVIAHFTMREMNEEIERNIQKNKEAKEAIVNFTKELELLPDVTTSEIFIAIESGEYEEALRLIEEAKTKQNIINIEAKVEAEEWDTFNTSWNKMVDKDVNLAALINEGSFDDVETLLEGIDDKNIDITATSNVKTVKEELEWFDEEGKSHIILVDVETKNVDKAKDKIEEIPTEKMLEIKLQGDIDIELQNIISQAEIVQTAMEWEAKIEIAEAEAAAAAIQAAFEAAGDAVIATSAAASSMFGDLAAVIGDLSTMDKWFMQDILKEQMELQRIAVEDQSKLIAAQISLMKLKEAALKDGEALITIDSNGLEPALEMIMWQILEKIQVKATGASSDFLLGL